MTPNPGSDAERARSGLSTELRLATDDAYYIRTIAANYASRDDLHGQRHYQRLLNIAARLESKVIPAASVAGLPVADGRLG